MDKLIQFQHVSFEYTGDEEGKASVPVLHHVDLAIRQGEFVAVLGHNGSGKSTLAKHINAILRPTDGVVYVEGIDTSDDEMVFEIRQHVGMVFQNPDNQLVATVVEEDVAFGPENLGIEPNEIRKRVEDSLKSVGMYELRDRQPHLLSGGQKQRVAIAGIIAMKPKCIIFDEATAMLDPSGRKEVMKTIKRLNKEDNITTLHITHFMEEAVDADRVIVMEKGKKILEGTPKEVFSKIDILKNIGLDVPCMTELSNLLKKEGLEIRNDILTVDEMVMELCQL